MAWPGGTSGPLPHLPLAPALTQNRCYHLDQKSHGVTSVGLPGLSIPSFDMVCAFGCSSVAWRSALGIVMVEWLKSQPLTLESKLGARSCPGCFASDPLLASVSGRAEVDDSSAQARCLHAKHGRSSWLHPGCLLVWALGKVASICKSFLFLCLSQPLKLCFLVNQQVYESLFKVFS